MARGLICRRPTPQPQPQPVQQPSDSISLPQPTQIPQEEIVEHPVPLVAVNVFTTIHDLAVETTIEQLYCNTELDALEVEYIFPLDKDSVVTKFEAVLDSGIIRGVVQPNKEAKATYDRAIRENRQAALLRKDSDRDDAFTCAIGNLKAGESCTIRITTLSEIRTQGNTGVLKWSLPTTAAPLNAPVEGYYYEIKHASEFKRDMPALSWIKDITKPKLVTGDSLPYRLGITIDVKTPSSVISITSTHHKIVAIPVDGDTKMHHIVTLAEGSLTMDQMFELNIEQTNPWGVRAIAEKLEIVTGTAKNAITSTSLAVQLTILDRPLDATEAMTVDLPCEIIFLVDRSGSMEGLPMEATKATLQIFLRSLPEKAKFNIYSFSSGFTSCFKESTDLNDRSLDTATRYIEDMRADGGTELTRPLKRIYEQKAFVGYPRQVFVLTDGQVSDVNAVVKVVKDAATHTRTFAMGIGSDVSVPLCQGIADGGFGTVEFVRDMALIAQSVTKQLSHALQAGSNGVTVDWGSLISGKGKKGTKLQIPHVLPPIYTGSRYFLYGMIQGDTSVFTGEKQNVLVSCSDSRAGGAQKTWTIPINGHTLRNDGTDIIHKLAARARIRELEKIPVIATGTGKKEADDAKAEMIALAVKYQVSSRETSFVAVTEATAESQALTAAAGAPELKKRDVQVAVHAGHTVPVAPQTTTPARTNHGVIYPNATGTSVYLQQQQQHNYNGPIGAPRNRTSGPVPTSNRSSYSGQPPSGPSGPPPAGWRQSTMTPLSSSSSIAPSSSSSFAPRRSGGAPPSAKMAAAPSRPGRGGFGGGGAPTASRSFSKSAAPSAAAASLSSSFSLLAKKKSTKSVRSEGVGGGAKMAEKRKAKEATIDFNDDNESSDNDDGDEKAEVEVEAEAEAGGIMLDEDTAPAPASPSSPSSVSSVSSSSETLVAVIPSGGDYAGLIRAQKSDGGWDSGDVKRTTGYTTAHDTIWTTFTSKYTTTAPVDASLIINMVATALAIAILERCFASQRAEWILMATKARTSIIKKMMKSGVTNTPAAGDWNAVVTAFINDVQASVPSLA